MRSALILTLLIAVTGWAAGEPPTPPAPAPSAVSTSFPAFDAGLGTSFYAEQNIYTAYAANPAYFNLFPQSFAGGDAGGDLSFGGVRYRRNHGTSAPGPTNPDEQAGLRVSYTAGLGGRGLGAYRRDFWNIGGTAFYNRTAASFAYNGASLALDPFFATGGGWTNADAASQSYGVTAAGSAFFNPHVAGLSFTFRPEKLEGSYDFEYLPGTDQSGNHRWTSSWGRRELKDYHLVGGYSFRGGETFDVGGAAGYRALRSTVDWRKQESEEAGSVTDEGFEDGVKIKGNGFTLNADGRYSLWGKMRLGGAFAVQALPRVTLDFRNETWDLVGPFGRHEWENYRLATAAEKRYRVGGGVAFYPDERTTLAFDYGYDLLTERAKVYDAEGALADELELSAYHTFTRLGAERWFIDNLAARVGWRQNLFGTPRNVFWGGFAYKFDDNWFITYDYEGGSLTLHDLSLFVPFDEAVQPASHRFTVIRYL